MVEAADGGLWGAAGATSRIDHRQGRRRKDTRILVHVEVTLTHTREVGLVGSGVAAKACVVLVGRGRFGENEQGRPQQFICTPLAAARHDARISLAVACARAERQPVSRRTLLTPASDRRRRPH